MRWTKALLAVLVFAVLSVMLAACLQTPPAPEEPAGGPGIVRDLTVPGHLNAARATVRDALTVNGAASVGSLAVRGRLQVPSGALTTDALAGFHFPLVLSGNITESFTFTDIIAAALLPNDVTVGAMEFFARAISNTVECNVLYTTAGITPTMNTIAITSTILTAGELTRSGVDNGTLGAGYLVEFVCNTDPGGYARDVKVTLWLK